MLSTVHLPWDIALRDRASYELELGWTGLGGYTLVECRSSPLAGRRGQREIRMTDGDYVGLLMVLAGREQVRQGDLSTALGPGDMILWDGTAPLDFEVAQTLHKVTLLIPRHRLDRALGTGATAGARQIDSRSGLGGLLAGHLSALRHLARDIPADDSPFAADMVTELLARLLDPADAAKPAGGIVAKVLECVEARLDDPDLTPTTLAAELGITPRYLHMAFAATGNTLAAHIRARRLECIRHDLADPRLWNRSVTDIVLRWGYNDPAHASRAFRKAFGLPPSRFRAEAGATG